MIQTRAEAKHLSCSKKIGPLPQTVVGDKRRLRQVLVNLLGNAIKFTNRGTITLLVGAFPDDYALTRFQVIDTGIGIAPEYVETVFDPFEQVSDHTHPDKGTGLGLAISRELVELMGGTLQVKSELARAAPFGLIASCQRLPIYPNPSSNQRAPSPASRVSRPKFFWSFLIRSISFLSSSFVRTTIFINYPQS